MKSRLNLLSEEEKAGMGAFVDRKIAEAKERTLHGWEPFEEAVSGTTKTSDGDTLLAQI